MNCEEDYQAIQNNKQNKYIKHDERRSNINHKFTNSIDLDILVIRLFLAVQ
jgi:hypothetical protein